MVQQSSLWSLLWKPVLKKRSRQHVHLSKDKETANSVGQRHGKPIVITVVAQQMAQNGQ